MNSGLKSAKMKLEFWVETDWTKIVLHHSSSTYLSSAQVWFYNTVISSLGLTQDGFQK